MVEMSPQFRKDKTLKDRLLKHVVGPIILYALYAASLFFQHPFIFVFSMVGMIVWLFFLIKVLL